jgi:hypothetical protein
MDRRSRIRRLMVDIVLLGRVRVMLLVLQLFAVLESVEPWQRTLIASITR